MGGVERNSLHGLAGVGTDLPALPRGGGGVRRFCSWLWAAHREKCLGPSLAITPPPITSGSFMSARSLGPPSAPQGLTPVPQDPGPPLALRPSQSPQPFP